MKCKLIMLLAALLVSFGAVQAADSTGVVVYDKTDAAVIPNGGEVPEGHALEIQFYIANDTVLGGFSLGLELSCADPLTITWDAQTGGHGASEAVTVNTGSRMYPLSGSTDIFNITEQDVDGTLPDSIMPGGVAMMGPGLSTGAYEHLYSLHLTLGAVPSGETYTFCIDSTFVPPAGEFLFVSAASGVPYGPGWAGQYCIDVNGPDAADGDNPAVPASYGLDQNYPNPFNPNTVIKYSLERKGLVNISIFNILGQKVKTLIDEEQEASAYEAVWHGDDESGAQVASGIYFYKMVSGDYVETHKMVLMR